MTIEILGASAPAWANHEHTAIDMTVNFSHMPGEPTPFTASPDDASEHGRELFARAKFGEYGEIGPCLKPTREEQDAAIFPILQRQELERVEALIAPLQRSVKFGLATAEEERELTRLEMHSVMVMKANSLPLPTL